MNEFVSALFRIVFYSYISAEVYFFGIFRTAKFEWVAVL